MAGRNRNAGEMLVDMKLADLIGDAGRAIAEAQASLDASSIRLALALAESRISTTDKDGRQRELSLIELGFMPSFYHFSTASFEFKLSITTKLEQSLGAAFNAGVASDPDALKDANKNANPGEASGTGGVTEEDPGVGASNEPTERSVMFGAAFNIDYHHKYGYDATASTVVTVSLSAVPAPAAFRDFVSAAAAGSATSTVTTP